MRLLASLLMALALTSPAGGQEMVPSSAAQIQLSFAPLVKATSPAVVNIFAEWTEEKPTDPFMGNSMFGEMLQDFGEAQPRVQNSLGSGVILSQDGIVVSNYHVVGRASKIRVVLTDRREYSAKVLLGDEETDLAILKIESETPLPWLSLRNSDEVEVGELVLAIGNPFGIGQTVSSGIISGLARSGVATGNARGYFLQTDAPVNPGNSGGALIDMAGHLVGINTSILTRSGGSNGIGFAIPTNLVEQFVTQAKEGNATFMRPWAGITGGTVNADLAQGAGLAIPQGIFIGQLHPESPFGASGLIKGDIILLVDGQEVNTPAEMIFRMSVRALGDEIDVTYVRDGVENSVNVTLMGPPETLNRDVQVVEAGVLKGLVVSNINAAIQAQLRLSMGVEGVVVMRVPRALVSAGFRPGDLIREINGTVIQTADDVIEAAKAETRAWEVIAQRGGRIMTFRFRM